MYDLNMERVLRNREALQACLDRAAASGETPGISLLVTDRKGEDCFLASGYADPASRRPLSRDSIFRCYSMTKPLTSCAAMMLMQEGKLDMFHPVSRYFSSFRSAASSGTIFFRCSTILSKDSCGLRPSETGPNHLSASSIIAFPQP